MKLFDVIDEEVAESMLNQHGRYKFGKIAVQRIEQRWWVYWGALEMHIVQGAEEPVSFCSLAAALNFALSPRQQELAETSVINQAHPARSVT